MTEAREHSGGRFRAPARQTGIAVGRVADEREIVGNGRRRHAEPGDDAGFVANRARAAVHLDHARSANALGQILVGRADDHAFDVRIERRSRRCGRKRIVGLVFDHRPHCDAEIDQRILEQLELIQKIRIDAVAGFVRRPQPVAERLDDVIGSDADVRRAAVDHSEDGQEHPTDGGDFAPLAVACARHRVVMAEQLVRAIDQVHLTHTA